ncbi:MAG: trigger factor [Candidatus Puniceispirillales bacterium]
MDVTEKSAEGLKREYNITMTAADISARVDARIAELATQVNMPGFRPGKVPAAVVKTRYGKQVLGEVLQAGLDEATRKIIEDNDLRVATNPNLNVDEYEEGGDLKATIALEVMPDIEEVDLSSLTVDKAVVEVEDSEVDEAVARIAEENRPTTPVEKPRAIKSGDTAVIDFVGRIDGEAFEGGSGSDHPLGIGSNTFIPGFEDGLIGAMPGSTVDVKVNFPADYPAEHLAGKEAVFETTIKELREPGEAKMDDAFAESLGLENLAALKDAVRDQINRQHATAIRTKVKTAVLDALDGVAGEFDVPPSLVAQEYDSICKAMNPQEHDHSHDHDHDHDHDHHHPAADEGMSDEDKAEADSIARRRVRLGMVLTDVGRRNNLQVTDEEKNRAVFQEAQRYPGQEQQVLEYFQQNPQAAQQLAGPIFEDKVIDFILEMATVNEQVMTVEELYKADDEPAAKPAKKAAKKSAKKAAAKKAAAKKAPAKKAAKKAAAKKK